MFKLIVLEKKKISTGSFVAGVCIANIVIVLLVWFIPFVERLEGDMIVFGEYADPFYVIGQMVRITFIVFAAVLIARIVIDEYKNKTIHIMFTYPIKRKKIMVAKLAIVSLFTFITVLLSTFFVTGAFLALDSVFHFVPQELTSSMLIEHGWTTLVYALSAAGISLVPLYFGMKKKSVPITIVSSIIVVAVISGSYNNSSLDTNLAIPVLIGCAGIFVAYWTIRQVNKEDLE